MRYQIPCCVLNCRVLSESQDEFEQHYKDVHGIVARSTPHYDHEDHVQVKTKESEATEEPEAVKMEDLHEDDAIVAGKALLVPISTTPTRYEMNLPDDRRITVDLSFIRFGIRVVLRIFGSSSWVRLNHSAAASEMLQACFDTEPCKRAFQNSLVGAVFSDVKQAIIHHPLWPWSVFAERRSMSNSEDDLLKCCWTMVVSFRGLATNNHEISDDDDEPSIFTRATLVPEEVPTSTTSLQIMPQADLNGLPESSEVISAMELDAAQSEEVLAVLSRVSVSRRGTYRRRGSGRIRKVVVTHRRIPRRRGRIIQVMDLLDVVRSLWEQIKIFTGSIKIFNAVPGSIPNIACLTAQVKTCKVCLSTLPTLRIGDEDGVVPQSDLFVKNRRRNTSAVIRYRHSDSTLRTVLIDCGKSFYEACMQWFVRYGLRKIDALILTHGHADAMNGLDDLRQFTIGPESYRCQSHIDIHLSKETMKVVGGVFPYLVDSAKATGGGDIPTTQFHIFDQHGPAPFSTGELEIIPFEVYHGVYNDGKTPFICNGFRMGPLSYVSDVSFIPEEAMNIMRGSQVIVIDALRLFGSHISHFGVDEAIEALLILKPKVGYLVGFSHASDHDDVNQYLSANKALAEACIHVEAAYDGQRVSLADILNI
ncbi:hypothetical protein SmJEL517_g00729 [Synchytrium microbalum]|uniref:Metallo-beta-lactamase domain-containing protein n=1 Tax=Synchytrium microbalum TaxID=1806994 RepID=A0A507CHF0_9FUNG|nr:uncharacterized protein SmJEL517_g00729 [Synchytrium microbalum]TPX37496.1 hypothetical protein SmJEL517_g00729 [Synchytrium microbalum]